MPGEMTDLAAIERLHADASGVVGPSPGDTPPWLNQTTIADLIARGFCADVVKHFADDDETAFGTWLDAECERWNDLYLGYQPGETPGEYKRGPWNTPDNLGVSIPVNMKFDCDDTAKAVRDAFMITAANVVTAVTDHVGEDLAEWGWQLDAASETLAKGLLGLPIDSDIGLE